MICVAPATVPQTMTDFWMFFRYSADNGEIPVGALRSTRQSVKLDSVPELVACEAEAGARM